MTGPLKTAAPYAAPVDRRKSRLVFMMCPRFMPQT
jgi:hypothetical protein